MRPSEQSKQWHSVNRQRSSQSISLTDRDLLWELLTYVRSRTEESELPYSKDYSSTKIVGCIKQVFDKVQQQQQETESELNDLKNCEQSRYEQSLQKLEAEVRQHIRVQQQLKLYIETNQNKMEDMEKQLLLYKSQSNKARPKENNPHLLNVRTEECAKVKPQLPIHRPNSQQYNTRVQANYFNQGRQREDKVLQQLLNNSIQ